MKHRNTQDENAHVIAYYLKVFRGYWLRAADELSACDFAHTYLERALKGMEWPIGAQVNLARAMGTLEPRMLVLRGAE